MVAERACLKNDKGEGEKREWTSQGAESLGNSLFIRCPRGGEDTVFFRQTLTCWLSQPGRDGRIREKAEHAWNHGASKTVKREGEAVSWLTGSR